MAPSSLTAAFGSHRHPATAPRWGQSALRWPDLRHRRRALAASRGRDAFRRNRFPLHRSISHARIAGMDFKLSPEQERFRAICGGARGQWSATGAGSARGSRRVRQRVLIDWQRKLHAAGYVGCTGRPPTGRGPPCWSRRSSTRDGRRAPPSCPTHRPRHGRLGAHRHATEKQKQAHLPKILSATISSAGILRAQRGQRPRGRPDARERKNGYYLINGQKVWTYANWCIS